MKVALVTPVYGTLTTGLERHVHELALAILRAGGEVDVLTEGSSPHGPRAEEPGSVEVRRFRPAPGAAGYTISRDLWSWMRDHAAGYDLVHAHGLRTLPVLLASRARPRRLVFTPHWHSSEPGRFGRFVSPVSRRIGAPAIEAADQVFCVSDPEAAAVRRLAPSVGERTHLIPNGADVASIVRAAPLEREHGTVILAIGRLRRVKRFDRLISALPALPASHRLVIIGEGPARSALQSHAADLRVADRVHFPGALADADYHRWLRTASVAATVGEEAACGLPVLEALAAGIPVVASAGPVHDEVAQLATPSRVRLVRNDLSPLALADDLARAAALPHLEAGGAPVPTWEQVTDRMVALYGIGLGADESPNRFRREALRLRDGGSVRNTRTSRA
jgi:glycosyltransferase involved in cell wall biosynthesis